MRTLYYVHDRRAENNSPYIFTGSLEECQKYINENKSPYLTPRLIQDQPRKTTETQPPNKEALPLYKVLIERQKIESGLIPSILAAQEFTMLAVANLVPLAEALEALYNAVDSRQKVTPEVMNKANEALNKIS